jgi:hypothetical protein
MKNHERINTGKSIVMSDAQMLGNFMKILSMDLKSGNLGEINHEFKSKEERRQFQPKALKPEYSLSFCIGCGNVTTPDQFCTESCNPYKE